MDSQTFLVYLFFFKYLSRLHVLHHQTKSNIRQRHYWTKHNAGFKWECHWVRTQPIGGDSASEFV